MTTVHYDFVQRAEGIVLRYSINGEGRYPEPQAIERLEAMGLSRKEARERVFYASPKIQPMPA